MIKDQILRFLDKNANQHFNVRQITRHLGLRGRDEKPMRQILRDLVAEGKIILHPEERFSHRDVNKILKGVIRIHREGFGFLIPDSKKKTDVFVPARHTNFAMNGDTVLVESVRNKRDGRYEGRVIQVIDRNQTILIGQISKKGKQHFIESEDLKGIEVYVPKKHLHGANDGDHVSAKMIQYPGPGILAIAEVTEVMGLEPSDEDYTEAVLQKYGIKRGFPAAVQQQLAEMPDDVRDEDLTDRFDLTEFPIITIDGITAKDFDDAVCVIKEGSVYKLFVSIADVAHYVRQNSPLDQEAFRRGTSTYLPDECIPMLPEKISNNLCSLVPYKTRLTMTAELHFNARFEFVRCYYYNSYIKSKKRATYEEVQAYFDGTNSASFDAEIETSLNHMKVLAEAMRKKSRARGSMGFDLPEAEVVYDVHGKIQTIQKATRFFSHKLIEEFMVAANVAVAQYFTSRSLPLIYRVHEQPESVKLSNFIDMLSTLGVQRKRDDFNPQEFFDRISGHRLELYLQRNFLRSLKQAVYDVDNRGHFGLQLDDYAHFTSPIRRYPDLTVHRQLKSALARTKEGLLELKRSDLKKQTQASVKGLAYDAYDLGSIAQRCSTNERSAMEAERDVLDIKRAFFMRDFVGERYYGKITHINKNGMFIELEPFYVEAFLPMRNMSDDYYIYDDKKLRLQGRSRKKNYQIGDRLWVIVEKASIETGKIDLALEAAEKAIPKRDKKDKNRKDRRQRRGRGRRK